MHGFEETLRSLAAPQHGVVTRRQLLGAGTAAAVIDRQVARGRLTRLHRGVYLAGPGRPAWCEEMAAVLAYGEGTWLADFSAALLWGLLPLEERGTEVDVVRVGSCRPRPGIHLHRTTRLAADDTTHRLGIPVTTPLRTILDLARRAPDPVLDGVVSGAIARRLVTPARLRRRLARRQGWPGTPRLAAWLDVDGEAMPRSVLERAFLAAMREAALPLPAVNVMMEGREVDFLWRRERLAVETDGFVYHSNPQSARKDGALSALLARRGIRLVRLGWDQVVERPMVAVAIVAGALAAADAPGG